MQRSSTAKARNPLLLCVFILGLMATLVILPLQFRTEAGGQKGLLNRTESHVPGLENYDIREAKGDDVGDALFKYRQSSGKDAAAVADVREGFVRGEESLKQRVPSLMVEYNADIRIPEVIAPDVKQGRNFLTGETSAKRSEVLRGFVKENNSLIGVSDAQADALKVLADYTNPDGNLSFAHLEQRINDIPVFRGEVKAGFTKNGEMIRVINNLAPGLEYSSLSTTFGDPRNAVRAAAGHINADGEKIETAVNSAASTDLKTVFGQGDWATTAEKMYFPTEPGVAVPAWRVLIWQPVNAYYVIVDGETGTMLWRKNITEDQTQPATYNIYANSNAMINAADSPAPLSPGPIDPTLGTQGAVISRSNVTLIGNEAPYTFNNNGWITDGANSTDGNYNEAGIDRVAPNGVDAPQAGDGTCPGAGCRTFTSTWNPPPGNPAPGDDPLTAQAQRGAVIQMFYVMNRYQSEMYRLGFTEQAFNFQNDNFGRGGAAVDRVSAEGQDSSGTNNANFSTPADGGRGRMQMFVWTGPTPDYDGTTDADVIIHEVTHGLSNRLHGNASGLSTNMARGMGEGWSDYYAHVMLSEPTDPINGIYTTGGYATYLATAGFTGNYYYGIRRYPKAVIAFTGGANNKPHNAFTFSYINADCNTRMNNTNFAFARGPFGVTQCDSVHNAGEVWSSALWEVRALLISRLGWAVGNRKVLQLVTDGMKLAPLGPTFLQERDAIIAAAQASADPTLAAADVADMWNGFRVRGMGFSARIIAASPANVVDGFDPPNAIMTNPITVSDSTGDNDGFPEPGENVVLSVPVTNNTGSTVDNVVLTVVGGGSANYGNVANGATVTQLMTYTVPAGSVCGSLHTVTINGNSAVGPLNPQTHTFRLGAPVGGAPATFTSSTLVNIPGGQPTTTSGPAAPYNTDITVSGLSGNKVIKLEITGITHTFPGDLDFLLVGPGGTAKYIGLSDSGGGGDVSNLTFTLSDGAAAQPSTAQWVAGDFRPYNSGANDLFAAPAPVPPYTNAAPGAADTFASAFGTSGAAMNGTWSLYIVDDAGSDFGTMAGWKLTFEANDFACSIAPAKPRADFDGDGKTDLSVFRSSGSNWFVLGSAAGFSATTFGNPSDVVVPGDYDNDGKADIAVFRPDANSANPDYHILNSNGNVLSGVSWGLPGDIPVSGDYDGDGKTDPAVFRPSTGVWYVLKSTVGATVEPFGLNGDVPLAMDQDGDGRTNLAVFRPGNLTWYMARNTGVPAANFDSTPFGLAGDRLVPADYDGDSKDDVAVFRNGVWYVRRSSNGAVDIVNFGTTGDVPVPGDYDGDGKDDQAVYRNGVWWLLRSTSGLTSPSFGVSTDVPIPARYIP